jgi:ADP-ribose pyrophosphatase
MTPNPAIFTNRCHAYLATGCRRVGDLEMDPGEDLELVLAPIREVDDLVRRGAIDHALALAALAMWRSDTGSGQAQ